MHNKPTISETVLLKNMYQNPLASAVSVDGSALEMDDKELQHHFEEFYEDVFTELGNFGKLEMLHVCDNLGDHLLGNVYAKFKTEEDADKAVKGLNGRFYAGRPIMVEFSPVTDFKEARCRQFDVSDCTRGGYCNFMHLKQIGPELSRKIFGTSRNVDHHGSASRRSPDRRDRGRDRRDDYRGGGGGGGGGGYRGGGGGGGYDRDRDRGGDRRDDRDRRDYRDRDSRDSQYQSSHRDYRERDRDSDRDRYRRDRDPRDDGRGGGPGSGGHSSGGPPHPSDAGGVPNTYPPYGGPPPQSDVGAMPTSYPPAGLSAQYGMPGGGAPDAYAGAPPVGYPQQGGAYPQQQGPPQQYGAPPPSGGPQV